MTTIEKFCEKLGLKPTDFEQTSVPKDRMDELEECIVELAEIIGGIES